MIVELLNAMPDVVRFCIFPAIRVFGHFAGWTVFDDGSILP